ncbi:MAG TPA: polysaccharide pyruvyl transferase family protein [Polyangiaceae bacterium]|nr:polysaccharide pyruvyl transferase family protein [Polyangiaceae bacterium]
MLIKEDGWDTLSSELLTLATHDRGLRYVPNAGNAGDALIACGTWQLFDDLGLSPVPSRATMLTAGDVAIYAGGGNLVNEYQDCASFLERCLAVGVRRALVLPQTVRGHEGLLQRLDDRFTIACRESESLERARASGTRAQLIFAPDLALRIDVNRLLTQCQRLPVRAQLMKDLALNGRLPAYLAWRSRLLRLAMEHRSTLHIIRNDVEAVAGVNGDARWDVSGLYWSEFTLRSEVDFVTRDLLMLMKSAREVVTNRLHAGVAAALVGRRVTYTDNSYGKIRAVYNSSLKDIDGISFAGSGQQETVRAA